MSDVRTTAAAPQNDREFQVWDHGRRQGHKEATIAMVRHYIKRNGNEMSMRKIADDLGLHVAQVSLAIDALQAEQLATKELVHRFVRHREFEEMMHRFVSQWL